MSVVAIRNCNFIKELTEGTDLSTGDLLFKDCLLYPSVYYDASF